MATIENSYTGDGSTVLYSFTFPYISTSDIYVTVAGANTTAYSLANATTVEFNAPPSNGAAIRIYRNTPTEVTSATFFPGSAVRAQDLNNNFEQTLFVAQETVAKIASADASSVQSTANQALSTAQQAEATANQAAVDVGTALITGDNVSELTNDAGYLTTVSGQNISLLSNDLGYITAVTGDISQLTNDVGYLTSIDLAGVSDVDSSLNPSIGDRLVWGGSQWAAQAPFVPSIAVLADVKSSNTDGGTASTNSFGTRDLNTIVEDPDSIVSLANDQFTLGAGSYLIQATVPAFDVGRFQAQLYDATNNSVATYSGSGFSNTTTFNATISHQVTLISSTSYEIRMRAANGGGSNGCGVACNFPPAPSIYTSVLITKYA